MRFFLYLTLIVTLFLSSLSFAQVTPVNIVKEKPTLDQILNHIQAKGVKLSNPRLLSGNIEKQVLTFENGYNANFEIDKGLVISTGNAKEDVLSRNLSPNKSSPNTGWYNDSDLTNIDNQAIYNTFVLEFDVVLDPGLTALRVAFQFGSEEYPDYVGGQYNDVFGFFVKGPGISGTKNMARLPSNNNPITINNINYGKYGGNSGAWSSPLKPTDLSQSDLYINNGHTTKIYSNSYPNMLIANINDADLKNYKRDIYIEWNGLTKLI
ncbi:MAG: choice-of-anchor L domain-containing protein, partial [Empedobacter falsenii]